MTPIHLMYNIYTHTNTLA